MKFSFIFMFTFFSAFIASAQWTTSGTNTTTTNKVGIGVDQPTQALEVNGTGIIGDGNWGAFIVDGKDKNDWMLNSHSDGESFYIRSQEEGGIDWAQIPFSIKRQTGNVGIGTLAPSTALQVNGKISITKADNLNVHNIEPNVNVNGAERTLRFNHNSITTEEGFEFYNQKVGQSLLFVQASGNVGIGTTDPKNKLSVNGTIWATKVKVMLNDAADWVFEDDYKLRSLAEVKEFIADHKHLPEMPSADEFRANDMEVSEMSNKLLQKIEELTLYTIEQEEQLAMQNKELKKLKELEKEVSAQKEKLTELEALKARMAKLEELLK